jgi:hypothetical protein
MNYDETKRRIFSRNPPSIKSKLEFYVLYEKGFFGNRAMAWKTYEEIIESGWGGQVCMRAKNGTQRKNVVYNIDLEKVPATIEEWKKLGIQQEKISFNQSMPDKDLTIQGELMNSERGLYLLYTTVKKPMNLGLREQELYAEGMKTNLMLKSYLSPSSYEDMKILLEMFPEDIIEFSSYRVNVGNIPGRNTVIWEVRNF